MSKPCRPFRASAMLVACLLCGCASTGFMKFGKNDYPAAGPENPVVQVMAMWQPANGVGNEGRTCRGFAGQVFFLTAGNPTPASVDGEVTIWLFDDQGTPEEQAKPIHKFKYVPEAWSLNGRKGPLGMTYTVFVPYTRKGSHEARCTLMVSFAAKDGPTVQSEMVNVEVSGIKNKSKTSNETTTEEPADSSSQMLSAVRDSLADEEGIDDEVEDAPQQNAKRPSSNIQQVAATVAADLERESSRPKKLTAAERDRIIREARARQRENEPVRAEEEEEEEAYAPRTRRTVRRNPLLDDERGETTADATDESERHTRRSTTRRRQNPLLDEDVEVEHRGQPSKKKRVRASRDEVETEPRRHPLSEDDSSSDNTRRREVFTISLSNLN